MKPSASHIVADQSGGNHSQENASPLSSSTPTADNVAAHAQEILARYVESEEARTRQFQTLTETLETLKSENALLQQRNAELEKRNSEFEEKRFELENRYFDLSKQYMDIVNVLNTTLSTIASKSSLILGDSNRIYAAEKAAEASARLPAASTPEFLHSNQHVEPVSQKIDLKHLEQSLGVDPGSDTENTAEPISPSDLRAARRQEAEKSSLSRFTEKIFKNT